MNKESNALYKIEGVNNIVDGKADILIKHIFYYMINNNKFVQIPAGLYRMNTLGTEHYFVFGYDIYGRMYRYPASKEQGIFHHSGFWLRQPKYVEANNILFSGFNNIDDYDIYEQHVLKDFKKQLCNETSLNSEPCPNCGIKPVLIKTYLDTNNLDVAAKRVQCIKCGKKLHSTRFIADSIKSDRLLIEVWNKNVKESIKED